MAQDTILIDVQVNAQDVAKQLKQATDSVKALKEENKALQATIDEQGDATGELTKKIAENNSAIDLAKKQIKSRTALIQAALVQEVKETETLDEQRHKLSILQKAYGALTDEQRKHTKEGQTLAQRIKQITESIKEQEHAIGQDQRNVGNYTESIQKLSGKFQVAIGGLGGMAKGLQGVGAQMKLLAVNPFIAILGALVSLLTKVQNAVKGNAELMQRWRVAMSAFEPAGIMLANILDKVATLLVTAIEKIADLITWFDKLTSKASKYAQMQVQIATATKAIAEMQNDLDNKHLDNITKIANAEKEVAELRAKVAEKDKYDAKARIGFLEQAIAKERNIAKWRAEEAELEYKIIKEQNALTASSQEEKEKEAQAQARMLQAQTEYFNTTRRLQSELSNLKAETAKTEEEQQQYLHDLVQKYMKEEEELWEKKRKAEEEWIKQRMEYEKQMQAQEDADIDADLQRWTQNITKMYTMLDNLGVQYKNNLRKNLDELNNLNTDAHIGDAKLWQARLAIADNAVKELEVKMTDADRKQFDKRYKLLQSELQNETITQEDFLSTLQTMYDTALTEMSDATYGLNEMTLQQISELFDKIANKITEYGSLATSVTSNVNKLMTANEKKAFKEFEKLNNKRKKAVDDRYNQGLMTQEDYIRQTEELEREKADKEFEMELAQAKREKAMKIMEIVINTAAGIAKAVSENPMYGGLPGSAIMATIGALQLAAVISEPLPTKGYAHGGIIGGTSYEGDRITAQVNSGEMILNKEQQAQLFNLANGAMPNVMLQPQPAPELNLNTMETAFANALKDMPAPILDYKEFTNFQKRQNTIKTMATV